MEQSPQVHFQKKTFLSDVTALKIWEHHQIRVLFAGENISCVSNAYKGIGPFLKAFCLESGDQWLSSCVLETSVIHGIDIQGADGRIYVVVFGQRLVKVLEVQLANSHFSIQNTISFAQISDWILDVCFWRQSQIVIGCAHNQIQVWNWKEQRFIAEYLHPENSILYSISFLTALDNTLVVACGNVCNQIIVWKISEETDNFRVDTINYLIGHQGIPFRLRWEFSENWNLISAADDRTVRLWKNVLLPGVNSPSTTMYGHQARVWDCIATNSFIISCGEDNTCRVWSFDGRQVAVFVGHDGKNIRSVAATKDGLLMASGGGDSRIKLWNMKTSALTGEGSKIVWELPSIENKEDSPRCVSLSEDAGLAYIACASGRIYQVPVKENQDLQKSEFIALGSFKVHSMKAAKGLLILGDSSGLIKVIDFLAPIHSNRELDSCRAHDKSVAQIFTMELMESCFDFCTSSVDGLLNFWTLREKDKTFNLSLSASLNIGALCDTKQKSKKQREHSISCMKLARTISGLNFIFLGDTSGNLYVCKLLFDQLEGFTVDVLFTEFGAHTDGNRVSDILIVQNISNWNIYSAGRDGTINQYTFNEQTFCKVATFKTAFEAIDSLYSRDNQLYAMGFVGSQMKLTNVSLNYNKLSIDCGGHKRSFDFFFNKSRIPSEVDYAFVYVNKKKITMILENVGDSQQLSKDNLHTQFHGLQCLSVVLLGPTKHGIQFVTSGEDAKLKLFSLSTDGEYQLECQQTLLAHAASIKCVARSENVLFTAGSFTELKAFRIHQNDITQETESLVEIPLYFQKSELYQNTKKAKHVRIMDVKAIQILAGYHCVIAGRSDSLIKAFSIEEGSGKAMLIAEGSFHNCAILCLELIHKNNQHYLFSGGTDGTIFLSHISELFSSTRIEPAKITPLQQMKIHQMGLNSLALQMTKTHCILVSGGDDQKLSLVQFHNDQMTQIALCTAHNTAVTTVQTLGNAIFTAGTDQRLSIWKLNGTQLVLLASCCLELADIVDMQITPTKKGAMVILVGCGLQIVDVEGLELNQ